MMTARNILAQFYAGLITQAECVASLERLQVRGAFDSQSSYIGYDYRTQQWVEADPR